MKILFLTLMEYNNFSLTGIYPDLINEFASHGHEVYVVYPCEEKKRYTFIPILEKGQIHLISAIIPNYFGEGFIQKGISSLVIGKRYFRALRKTCPDIRFDLILYSTPPISFCDLIKKIKKRDKASSYLLLKDIWPQGLLDVGALSKKGFKGLVYRYYLRKEKKLYAISDYIGCMSAKNCEYIINNSHVNEEIVELCPNSIRIRTLPTVNKISLRDKNGLPLEKTIFIYGGNLGVAQGIEFIIECLEINEQVDSSFILIIGSGTQYNTLYKWFMDKKPKNSRLMQFLPKQQYYELMMASDVGLIFLDHRFTIPNFPSRLLSYMEAGMPVLAATDVNTDVGTTILDGRFGYCCESVKPEDFSQLMSRFNNKEDCEIMGNNARQYLIDHFSVEKTYETIIRHFDKSPNLND